MEKCYLCGCPGSEVHHIMHGTGSRKQSDEYGLIVRLCYECHRGNRGVHFNDILDHSLKQEAQAAFEKIYGHDKWMAVFGRNYLDGG